MTMAKLFLIPIISIFDVHDVAVRDWLNKLDDPALNTHLESPFRLDRFFPESAQHVLKSIDSVHSEILRLLDIIDPQVVFSIYRLILLSLRTGTTKERYRLPSSGLNITRYQVRKRHRRHSIASILKGLLTGT